MEGILCEGNLLQKEKAPCEGILSEGKLLQKMTIYEPVTCSQGIVPARSR